MKFFKSSLLLLPRSLFARLMLILLVGMLAAYALAFGLIAYERGMTGKTMMLGNLERDVASSVAILDRLPPAERQEWLRTIERRNYHYMLEPAREGDPPTAALSKDVAATVANALDGRYPVKVSSVPDTREHIQIELRLSDGAPVTIDMRPSVMPMSQWLPQVLLLQLLLVIGSTMIAVRLATRPLAHLADAADSLGPDLQAAPLSEEGPSEVTRAAVAFNAMQARITGYVAERMQILAAITHDLQTPITRMRLRTEMMEDTPQREKLRQDLGEMEALVREGVDYARSLHAASEVPRRVDPDSFLDSLVLDYQDAGKDVRLDARIGSPIMTRPQALRRILSNLLDNALKFGSDVTLHARIIGQEQILIAVQDRGPGIPPDELESVLQPFYRVDNSRSRSTGGTGLGLAIAQQLAIAVGGSLILRNRDGGGLEASLTLQCLITEDTERSAGGSETGQRAGAASAAGGKPG